MNHILGQVLSYNNPNTLNLKRMKILKLLSSTFFLLLIIGCNNDNDDDETTQKDPITGSRIAWDYSGLQKLVPLSGNSIGYSSYPRMIEIENGDFLCVYESDGTINLMRSIDKGISWEQPIAMALPSNNVIMAVPEILQLSDGKLIITYNPRPMEPYSTDRLFEIRTIRSLDNGHTWENETLVYQADYTFENGCWEPMIIELNSGELQLYFANEADYKKSSEQNISMFRSMDKGLTWGEREVACFSPKSRDGMPVAIYLEETDEIIMSIEDNNQGPFKPVIIRTDSNWQNAPVGRNTPDRAYALNHNQTSKALQGSPYIKQAPSGNIVLSYQGSEDESGDDLHSTVMHVEIGDKTGRNFNNNTTPFDVPNGSFGIWNSIANMDGKIWALTSTNGFSSQQEVWTIPGYEIMDNYKIPTSPIDIASKPPFFVGHKGNSQAKVYLSQDANNLKIKAVVTDNSIASGDGISFYLDPSNISTTRPVSNMFKISVNTDGNATFYGGNNGIWELSDIVPENVSVNITEYGYEIDLSISWFSVYNGTITNTNERIGFTVGLTDTNPDNGLSEYTEELANSYGNEPYTWLSIKL